MKDKIAMWVAFRLPRRLAYWATIRVGANASGSKYPNQVVPELTLIDALQRWEIA